MPEVPAGVSVERLRQYIRLWILIVEHNGIEALSILVLIKYGQLKRNTS